MTATQVLGLILAVLGAVGLLGAAGLIRRDVPGGLVSLAVGLVLLAIGLSLVR